MRFIKESFVTTFLVDITSDLNSIRGEIGFNEFLSATKKFLIRNPIAKFEVTAVLFKEGRVFLNVLLRGNFEYKINGIKIQRKLRKKLRTVKKWFKDQEGSYMHFDD